MQSLHFLKKRYAPRGARQSFAQAGEDILMRHATERLKIEKPTYIDIGVHHPVFGNNTYLFYLNGSHGITIEPNKKLSDTIKKKRPRDTFLCAGVGRIDSTAEFYNFPQSTRSTFSVNQATKWEKSSGQKSFTCSMPILSLDTIIAKYCQTEIPDLISIDAEGYDIEILLGFNFKVRPKMFCVETLENGNFYEVPSRNKALYDLFRQHDYFPYAETPANTIFVDTLMWANK